ncbi:MAG TPA: adenosylcobinamide-GDP ribazoletransferase [Lachnospiraceae bacterium]|nr:adenosylcobinamide-GDP ribazoletransferase [Lachnospiraceae bacterium]
MILYSLIIAFAMYSAIPMPRVEWSEKNMRFSLCFFPLVGAAAGAACILWNRFSVFFGVENIARICILTAVPLVITGGIHADGFVDTMDAVHSWQDQKKKLEILKDSHIGAFAVIMLLLYYLCTIAAISEIKFEWTGAEAAFALSFVYSRALAGTALVFGNSARKEGLAYTFAKAGDLRIVRIILIMWDIACAAILCLTDLKLGIAFLLAGPMLVFRFIRHTKKEFGGLTGDLCGCFIMMAELLFCIIICVFCHLGN